jgi:hypothetical protein
MASLANQTISSSYDGLIKTATDNAVGVSGVQLLEDGSGNSLALSVGRANNGVTITGDLNATLATAAQPNITSVGTLSSLAVTGNLAVDTNTLYVDAANNRVGVGTSSLNTISGSNPTLTLAGTGISGGLILQNSGTDTARIYETGNLLIHQAMTGVGHSFYVNSVSEAMRIDSSGNVGIGESTPDKPLVLKAAAPEFKLISTSPQGGGANAVIAGSNSGSLFIAADATNLATSSPYISMSVRGSEKMRIDSSGNVGIGAVPTEILHIQSPQTTAASNAYVNIFSGHQASGGADYTGEAGLIFRHHSGSSVYRRAGAIVSARENNYSGDGQADSYLRFETAQNNVNTERMRITSDGLLVKYGDASSARIIPQTDGVGYLGESAARWNTVYATTGSINTSDANEKQQIESLDEAELRVAVAIKGLIKKFKFNDAVASKGDDARIHIGVIAQDVKAAFEAEGLDAYRYGLFCSDTWWESYEVTIDENGDEQQERIVHKEATEGAVEKTRLGVRYEELLAFVIAAL